MVSSEEPNNLAAVTSNIPEFQPTLVCGKALKSCNQKYNKTLAKLKSELPSLQKTSKRIQGLTLKRNCQVDYYLHTASKYIKYLGKINYILASKIVQHFFNVSEEALSVFIGAKFNPFIF